MTEDESEQIERVRQQIMRMRELLTIMRERQVMGEKAYDALFARITGGVPAGTREKDAQRMLSIAILGDTRALSALAGRMRFETHELERAFEDLQAIIDR